MNNGKLIGKAKTGYVIAMVLTYGLSAFSAIYCVVYITTIL